MPGRKLRRDVLRKDGELVGVAWGMRMYGLHPDRTDGLFTLYSLQERLGLTSPMRYAPYVTHEVSCFSLEGYEPIRFELNLWSQQGLIPILPAFVCFQLQADSDHDAMHRVQAYLDLCYNGYDGKHLPNMREHWEEAFSAAIHLSRPLLAYNDPDQRLRLVDDEDDDQLLSFPRTQIKKAS